MLWKGCWVGRVVIRRGFNGWTPGVQSIDRSTHRFVHSCKRRSCKDGAGGRWMRGSVKCSPAPAVSAFRFHPTPTGTARRISFFFLRRDLSCSSSGGKEGSRARCLEDYSCSTIVASTVLVHQAPSRHRWRSSAGASGVLAGYRRLQNCVRVRRTLSAALPHRQNKCLCVCITIMHARMPRAVMGRAGRSEFGRTDI